MGKVCLISHIADADGATPIILGKLVLKDLECYSVELDEVDALVKEIIEKENEYDFIYITDLNISEELAIEIEKNENLKKKIHIFDHHISSISLNQYSFIEVISETDRGKECGTTLFYQFLKENYDSSILEKEIVSTLVELVREMDTYDFREHYKGLALDLGSLYDIYGRERFIYTFLERIKTEETFSFNSFEKEMLIIDKEKTTQYIEEKLKTMKKAVVDGFKVGIVFAERHRSLIGHEMAKDESIDIAIIINVSKSVSYRASKEDVDVNKLAVIYGGGGHKHAGGNALPENLLENICEMIFHNVEWISENV